MADALADGEMFQGLESEDRARLLAFATTRALRAGEYLFLLGDNAEALYVVVSGRVDLCFPFRFSGTIRDIAFESKVPGDALGWSSMVAPYRFTLSARAAEASEIAAFSRAKLLQAFAANPVLGHQFYRQLASMIGHRLLAMQALWARELQRAMVEGLESTSEEESKVDAGA